MVSEIVTGIGLFKTLMDMAKGLKDINDASIRNAAIIELQEKILAARDAQTMLAERVRELEAEVASFETWEAEKQRYALYDFGGGTFAYVLKEEKADGEPPHKICANCFQQHHKSILQKEGGQISGQEIFRCQRCATEVRLGSYVRPNPQSRTVIRSSSLDREY